MILFKPGVSPKHMRAAALVGLLLVQQTFADEGVDTVVTSTTEGKHTARHSKHYSGDAFDLRSKHLQPERRGIVLNKLKSALGPDYVVILESPDQAWQHYHVHFAPLYNPTLRHA